MDRDHTEEKCQKNWVFLNLTPQAALPMCPSVGSAALFVGFSHAFIPPRFPAGPNIASLSQKMQELLLQLLAIAGYWHFCSCLGFIPTVPLELCISSPRGPPLEKDP